MGRISRIAPRRCSGHFVRRARWPRREGGRSVVLSTWVGTRVPQTPVRHFPSHADMVETTEPNNLLFSELCAEFIQNEHMVDSMKKFMGLPNLRTRNGLLHKAYKLLCANPCLVLTNQSIYEDTLRGVIWWIAMVTRKKSEAVVLDNGTIVRKAKCTLYHPCEGEGVMSKHNFADLAGYTFGNFEKMDSKQEKSVVLYYAYQIYLHSS